MSDLKQAKTLLLAAQRDFRALGGMLDKAVFADEIFGFHVQQAAEKAFKAWLAALGDVYPYTHDLGILLQRLESRNCDVARFWRLVDFSLYAVQFRYGEGNTQDIEIDREYEITSLDLLLADVAAKISRDR